VVQAVSAGIREQGLGIRKDETESGCGGELAVGAALLLGSIFWVGRVRWLVW
jgi:hypothetical protein